MKVKFLPKKSIEVEICDIYEDRDAVIVQHTDTLQENTCFNAEALGFKFGIKPCAFHWPYSALQNGLSDINNTGVLKFGVYVPTDRYRSETEALYLPDYSTTAVTVNGARYYGKNVGDSKPSGYPNNGQDLYNYTSGVKGYDIVNSKPGSEGNMDFIREMKYIDKWYSDNFARLPSAGSDRQGKIGSKQIYMPYYLGIRSTSFNGNVSYRNLERLDWIHKYLTSRWEYGFIYDDKPLYSQRLIDGINLAFEEKGLFNDFVHWHRTLTYGGIQQLEELYQLIYNTVNDRNAWYTGYSEAVEYYWFRSMTKRVRASFIEGKLHLIADFDDEFINENLAGIDKKLLYNRIKQPLSVKIDLTGTELAGKEITGANMISLGDNKFIVDIPFEIEENGFKTVVLEITESPSYKDFTAPIILSNISGVITTNTPTKAVMYKGSFGESMTIVKRSNTLSLNHNFNGLNGDKIGLISMYGVSSLIEM